MSSAAPAVVIRRAGPADVEELAQLAAETYAAAFGHSLSAPDLAAHLERQLSPERIARMMREDVFLVACVAERLIGFAQFGRAESGSDDQALRRLYVHAEFQNQRIGTALLEAALDRPQMQDAANVVLDVWEHNHAAQRLYRRHGFEVVGTRRFDVTSGAETSLDLIMARRCPTGGN